MIWPANLVTAALFNTLHSQETAGTQARAGISRERFFLYVFVGYIFYSQPFPPLYSRSDTFSRFLAILPVHCSIKFLMGLLDRAKQPQGQPTLWCCPWFVYGGPHL